MDFSVIYLNTKKKENKKHIKIIGKNGNNDISKYLLKKINIILLGAINRNNKRIFNMYIKKKFLWLNYNYYVKNKNN